MTVSEVRTPAETVGVVVHGGRPGACEAASEAADLLADRGVKVLGLAGEGWDDPSATLLEPQEFAERLDLLLVFGGDGTFLRAAHLAPKVPLLGVNLGRLGFLSEVEPPQLSETVERIAAGALRIEERMTLRVEVRDDRGRTTASGWALNEASVERTIPQRLIVLELRVNDRLFAHLPADALVCATPTGSTAYAFSARGPIVSPLVEAILAVPVAPHSLFDRTLLLDPDETLSIRPVSEDHACVVTMDGRSSLPVPSGGSVDVLRGAFPVRLARLQPFDFYTQVRSKFALP